MFGLPIDRHEAGASVLGDGDDGDGFDLHAATDAATTIGSFAGFAVSAGTDGGDTEADAQPVDRHEHRVSGLQRLADDGFDLGDLVHSIEEVVYDCFELTGHDALPWS